MAMRITGGRARGIPLSTGRARDVRPATDRMREAVFSSLREAVREAAFLDLFAGTGSYGLEALSRGARAGVFVEKNPLAVAALQQNLKAVLKSIGEEAPSVRIERKDALRFGTESRFDLIFMDPPYELVRSHAGTLLENAGQLLKEGGILAFEMPADMPVPLHGWELMRRIGKSGRNEPSVCLLRGGFNNTPSGQAGA